MTNTSKLHITRHEQTLLDIACENAIGIASDADAGDIDSDLIATLDGVWQSVMARELSRRDARFLLAYAIAPSHAMYAKLELLAHGHVRAAQSAIVL